MSDQVNTRARVTPETPKPWDPVVRLTHWKIAVAVIANGLLTKPGGTIHIWIGWAAMAMLALRLVWGLLDPAEARFGSFLPDPRAAVSHLADLLRGRPREHASHNPADAMMACALWTCLALVIGTGLFMTGGKSPINIAEEKSAVAAGDGSALVTEDANNWHGDEELGDVAEEVHDGEPYPAARPASRCGRRGRKPRPWPQSGPRDGDRATEVT